MHHIFFCQGLRSFSARRRRTVSRDRLSCPVRLTISPASSSSVQRARPAGGLRTGGGDQQRLFLAAELAFGARPRRLAKGCLQSVFDEAPLGPVDGRSADPDAGLNRFVAEPGIGGDAGSAPA